MKSNGINQELINNYTDNIIETLKINRFLFYIVWYFLFVQFINIITRFFIPEINNYKEFVNILTIALFLIIIYRRYYLLKSLKFNKNYKNITDGLPDELCSILNSILKELPRKLNTETWVSIKDRGTSPSVYEIKRKVYLIIPLGFFKLLKTKNGLAKAILAHEFSHVLQGDARLALIFKIFSRIIYSLILPVILIAILVKFGATNFEMQTRIEFLIKNFIGFVFLLFLFGKQIIFNSERVADLSAVFFTSPETTMQAIKVNKHSSKRNVFRIQPSPEWRIKKIEKFCLDNGIDVSYKPAITRSEYSVFSLDYSLFNNKLVWYAIFLVTFIPQASKFFVYLVKFTLDIWLCALIIISNLFFAIIIFKNNYHNMKKIVLWIKIIFFPTLFLILAPFIFEIEYSQSLISFFLIMLLINFYLIMTYSKSSINNNIKNL